MTDKQLKHFYFPAWTRCCDANHWRMEKTRLVGKRQEKFHPSDDINDLYQHVWHLAAQCAVAAHRGITPDDLRHACHRIALGHDKSAKDFTNPEVDRVVALFKLLRDPDDLDAVLDFLHPENQARARLLWTIEHSAPEAYISHLSLDRFGASDWRDLDNDDLRMLATTLRQRRKNWNSQEMETAENAENAKPF